MRLWTRVHKQLRTILRRSRMESEMDAELRFHIEACTEDLVRRGVPRGEAARQARVEFGGLDKAKEECRDARGLAVIEALIQDLRYGLRMFRKTPGFTAVALVSLALGIGANSTVFSIVDAELLRPWPVKQHERLVSVRTTSPKADFDMSSYLDYQDMATQIGAFSDAVAFSDRGGFISGEGQGREVSVEVVSQNFFSALGVNPLLGRVFSPRPDQTGAEGRSVLVSYNLWQRYFNSDPLLPGKIALLDGKDFTVIGVAPREFCGLRRGWSPDVWVTTEGWAVMVPGDGESNVGRGNRSFEVSGRLRPGVALPEARAQLQTLAGRLALASPATNRGFTFTASPAAQLDYEEMKPAIYLMAMVGLVLLISCANVANLLLAKTEHRQREIAMRRALGAGPRRLVRQLLTEGLLLSLAGGLLGMLLAALMMRAAPAFIPALHDIDLRIDGRVLLFTAAVALLTTLIFGLAPALRGARCDLVEVLKGGTRRFGQAAGRLPLRSLLVSGEIALSVVLLAGSGVLLRSLEYSRRINPGFNSGKNVLMLSVAPPELYGYSQDQAVSIYPALAERVEAVPGVIRASYARRPPLTGIESGEKQPVIVPGVQPPAGSDRFRIRYNIVAPKFFATVGASLESGREFDKFDLPSTAPVVIINAAMARRFWPGQDAVGKSIRVGRTDRRIVGVVESGRYVALHETAQPYLFLPFTQVFSFECMMFVETAGNPEALAHDISKAAASVARNLPIVGAVTLQDYGSDLLSGERSRTTLLTGLSILGMFLAAVGLYAAVAYLVNRRVREIGVRMALGAGRKDVLRLVLIQALRMSAVGAAAGLAGAIAASRLISGFIYGVTSTDPLSYTTGVLIAVGVALLASYIPARRAMYVDPVVALRYE